MEKSFYRQCAWKSISILHKACSSGNPSGFEATRILLKTIARALKPYAASRGFPARKEPDMIAHPDGMRPRSPQRLT
jgi:hypothetical protein